MSESTRGRRTNDRVFLEGPHSRLRELGLVLRTVREFIRGFRALHFAGPCVTVFGSASYDETHPYYAVGRMVGQRLARLGFVVITSGGPGLMEAVNRGAREGGGLSIGCNVELPRAQPSNTYLDRLVTFRSFFVRKILLYKYSAAFIGLPGGLGTLDELAEALTLIENGLIADFPVILIGKSYWNGLTTALCRMARAGTIEPADLHLLTITDDVEEALDIVKSYAIDRFAGRTDAVLKPSGLLGEHGVQDS